MPQNWLFLSNYKNYRESFLKNYSWLFVARLGEHAFENAEAAGAFACMIGITKSKINDKQSFFGVNAANNRGERPIYASEKKELVKTATLKILNQSEQLNNPDFIIGLEAMANSDLLKDHAVSIQGLATSDDPQFTLFFWELAKISNGWVQLRGTVEKSTSFGGCERIIHWEEGAGRYYDHAMALKKVGKLGGWKSGTEARNKKGVIISQMSTIPVSIYWGEFYDHNACVIVPDNENELTSILAYCFSPSFYENVRKIDQSLKPSNNTFLKVPFDLEYWQKIADEQYPDGLPQPYSDDATQWLFHGNPLASDNPLQVAMARLLGYHWPAESDTEMELADEAREQIAAIQSFNSHTDDDGIMCLPAINGELQAAERCREYLMAVWGEEWSNNTLQKLLQKEGANKTNLDEWLRDEFMDQHNKLFQNRPFIWQIWDGRKDGFSALVNYPKLNKENLSKLIYTYLGDWIRMCEAKVKAGESGAEGLRSAAIKLKEKLEAILQGEAPYDIFVRWKPLDQQPIGWEPDLNDGVRLNIRPFILADVLRKKPNIKWGVDRGKNPPGTPWGTERDNDMHLSLEEKGNSRK